MMPASRLLALLALLCTSAAAEELRVFPPAPPLQSPIRGAIDFHVHSMPDVFGRSLTDYETGLLARRAGMRAIVLKSHVASTAERAALLHEQIPELEVFGGITLNQAVGGLNPQAVEWMRRVSGGRGRVVWLPTIDAAHHMRTFGEKGQGLTVLRDGALTPEAEAVLQVVAREDLVLETGHLAPQEILAVARRARELGLRRLVVTHPMARVPGLDLAQMKVLADLGAVLELDYVNHLLGPQAHLPWMRHWDQVSIPRMAAAIREIGAAHFLLATDLGQFGNPTHPDGYTLLVQGLQQEGIGDADLDLMMRRTPARLLGLAP